MAGFPNKIECHHGHLRRSCPLCEYEAEVTTLRAQLSESERRRAELVESVSHVAKWWKAYVKLVTKHHEITNPVLSVVAKTGFCHVMSEQLDALAALVGDEEK